MPTTDKTYKLNHKDVVYTDLGDECVLLNLKTKYYFTLNETGQWAVQQLDKGVTFEELLDSFTREFEVERDQCKQDLEPLLQQFEREQVII